jgi:voltage-gated potassium channel
METGNTERTRDHGTVEEALSRERWALLESVSRTLEPVMVVLSAVWIALLVGELLNRGLPRTLDLFVWVIWAIFIADFAAKLLIAPERVTFLRRNWLTLISLFLPALRILRVAAAFRFLRAARVVRSVGLLRVVTSLNRGLGALGRTAQRRGVGYVVASTALVAVVGAAGMLFFESGAGGEATPIARSFADYGSALWWTASTMTTGAPTQPQTAEGRVLSWLLSVYGLAIFGYLTAILASHFVGQDQAGRVRV